MTLGKLVEDNIFYHLFGQFYFTPPTSAYLGLLDGYSPGTELADMPGYERAGPIAFDDWEDVVDGRTTNKVDIIFDEAGADWSRIVGGWVLSTTDYPGQVWIAHGYIDEPAYVKAGMRPRFAAGSLELTTRFSGGFSRYMENMQLEHLFWQEVWEQPDPLYIGLLTGDPGSAATNENCNEVPHEGVTGYTRVATAPGVWNIQTHPVGGPSAWNVSPIHFPRALDYWGTITHFALFDSEFPTAEGHILLYGLLLSAITMEIGKRVHFSAPVEDVEIGETGILVAWVY